MTRSVLAVVMMTTACSQQQTCPDGYGIRSDGTCIPIGGVMTSVETPPQEPAVPRTDGTDDTTPPWTGDCVDVSTFSFELVYAWDSEVQQAAPYTISQMPQSSLFTIEYGESNWDGDPQTKLCEKSWSLDGLGSAGLGYSVNSFVVNPTLLPLAVDTCTEAIDLGWVCPDFFDSSNGIAVQSIAYEWEVFDGVPMAEVAAAVGPYFDPGMYWDASLDAALFAEASESYGFGFSVDEVFEVTSFDPDIGRAAMASGNGQVDGLYTVANPYIWAFN